MSVAVRFAPSPTGMLHVGNIRLALINWLFARSHGGSFLLRLDDTDLERSTAEFAAGIERDLGWLGLDWDRFARQSDRLDRYHLAMEALKRSGRLYPCYETAEELSLKRKSLLGRSLPPIYDRSALKLTDEDRARLEGEGRRPHWRFLLRHDPVEWDDLVRGPQHFHGRDLSDPVLIREDGRILYTLSSIVDDIELGITHVIRGEDHVANTAVQIQLWQALDGPVPTFAHLPLLSDATGAALSKRLGSIGISHLRDEEGVEPMAINSLLAKLGTSDAIEARLTLAELVAEFDMAKVSRGAPKFDPEELKRLNARVLHATPFQSIATRLEAKGYAGVDEVFWNAVRANLSRLDDIAEWWHVAREPIQPVIEDAEFAAAAASLLPAEPWDDTTWSAWTGAVKTATGRKGKALFMPLRQALTGLDHGPELKNLLPLIGRERAGARLAGQVS
ncbi:glutamate--tRNA ligase 1 [Skermanella aerolata]|uniref:Glutamate--tRNA ligase n=1 Tax=Skermanella aerolata TaxID=393310 RepID=A0A512DIB7_9PROT|nr:glutamate--tRNA ligase [Skermanella aerolata]KJB94019.1 glutamyl-tRNA synthetase [Skermanella aerolata KACC 11604]GEO35960.1 glutamate--tRNA ligase 1 [Skermanella aerolata]